MRLEFDSLLLLEEAVNFLPFVRAENLLPIDPIVLEDLGETTEGPVSVFVSPALAPARDAIDDESEVKNNEAVKESLVEV